MKNEPGVILPGVQANCVQSLHPFWDSPGKILERYMILHFHSLPRCAQVGGLKRREEHQGLIR